MTLLRRTLEDNTGHLNELEEQYEEAENQLFDEIQDLMCDDIEFNPSHYQQHGQAKNFPLQMAACTLRMVVRQQEREVAGKQVLSQPVNESIESV